MTQFMKFSFKIIKFLSLATMSFIFLNSVAFASVNIDKKDKDDIRKATSIIEKAKKGDKKSIEIIKNLEIFDKNKVEEKITSNNLELSSKNPVVVIKFGDGSEIEYKYESIISLNDEKSVAITTNSSRRTESVSKTYRYLGVTVAKLYCYADVTYVSRYKVHINSCWHDAWSTGSLSALGSSIIENDAAVAKCEAHGQYALVGGIAWSEWMSIRMNIDSAGVVTYR